MPDWLQEFEHGLVDKCVPEHREISSSSHELLLEPRAKAVPSKHNIFIRNCHICLRKKIWRSSWRRRIGSSMPREDNFMIKKLQITESSAKDMSLDIIVDTLGWYKTGFFNGSSRIRAKQKLLIKHKGAHKRSWGRPRSQESFTWRILWNLAKFVTFFLESLQATPHSSEMKGIVERAACRIKEGTFALLLQSGLDENWWAVSMECWCYLRNIQDLLSDGKTQSERLFGVPLNGPVIPFGVMVQYHFISAND